MHNMETAAVTEHGVESTLANAKAYNSNEETPLCVIRFNNHTCHNLYNRQAHRVNYQANISLNPGARRYNRWLNQKLLYGNLRRLMHAQGEELVYDMRDASPSLNLGYSTYKIIRMSGRSIYVAPGIQDLLYRMGESSWTKLRHNSDAYEAFRKSEERDSYGNDKKNAIEILMKRTIHRTIAPYSNRTDFHELIDKFLNPIEIALRNFVSLQIESSSINIKMTHKPDKRTDKELHQSNIRHQWIWHNSSRSLCPLQETDILDGSDILAIQEILKMHQNTLVLWNLSRFHRELTHVLSEVWKVTCIHEPLKNENDFARPRKVIIIYLTTKQLSLFSYPPMPICDCISSVFAGAMK